MTTSTHSGFDHVTIAVVDLEEAERFFALVGFEKTAATTVSGDTMSRYMGIPDWKADHVTLTLRGAATHQEVQLLRFQNPPLTADRDERNLARLGFNHVCFAVEDLDATLAYLADKGVQARSQIMDFHDRRLVFLVGPGDVTVELAEWVETEHG
jgi:catechol 2,3-dioxygenase-like lactoylglutathione lyase family enzyme